MAKKQTKKIRGWHNPPKIIPRVTKGRCEFCGKLVNNLEGHKKTIHRQEMGE